MAIRVTTIWPNGQTSKTETDYDSAFIFRDPMWGTNATGTTATTATYSATLGTASAHRQFDWGQGASGPLLRQTANTYRWQSNSNYLTANMLDLVSSVQVKDPNGNICAETDNGFDDPSRLSTYTGSTANHLAPPNAVRGNLTSVSRKLTTTACSITSSTPSVTSFTNWYDTGEVYQSMDPLGHTTTHSYDSTYFGAYSTQTCAPQIGTTTHCVEGTYDFGTGLLTSFTDANNQTSNFSYDNEGRLTSAVSPSDLAGLHPETDFGFPTATTVQRTKKQDSSHNIVDYAYFDGLGRTKLTCTPKSAHEWI